MEGEEEIDLIYISEEPSEVDGGNEGDEEEKEEYDVDPDGIDLERNDVDLNEDAYEIIRDEEDILDEVTEDAEKEQAGGADDKGGVKEDNMLVVDEWDNHEVESISDEEDQTKTEDGKDLIDPEESEKALLHMPSLKTIMGDLLHLRRNRRVSIYPVSMEDLNLPALQQYLDSEICEEVKMQFIRPTDDMKTWTGFVSLMFVTSKNATQAIEVLKDIREGLTVKVDPNPDASLDSFLKGERKNAAWPAFWADRLLLVRSIPIDTKPEDLRAIFTDAEEIVVAKESASAPPKRRDTTGSSALGYAYILYESTEAAKTAAENLMAQHAEFNNKLLDIQLYREPTAEVPRSLLFLRRRRLVLKHLNRLLRNVEKAEKDPEYKLPPNTETRIAKCKALIEKDDKARTDLKLPTPTFEDFKQMRGFRPYTPKEAERALFSLGIVVRTKKVAGESTPSTRRDKDKPSHKRSEKNRGGNAGRGNSGRGPGRGNFRQGPGGVRDRRSPPGGRRRNDWGPGESRRGDFMGRNRNGGSRGMNQSGGLGMMNPLALMQNMGLLGASGLVNQAVLNPMAMMMQPSVGNLLSSTGLSGMSGQGPMGGGSSMEPPPKMLRLDETGNLRADRDFRHDRDGRGFERGPRDDRNMFRDRGRQRSRSPEYRGPPMRAQRGGLARSGFGNGGPRGYEPSGIGGGARGGENDLSLLMNLSQMLSQTMDQKRHQADHGYDRM